MSNNQKQFDMIRVYIICSNQDRVITNFETVKNYRKLNKLIKDKCGNNFEYLSEEPIEMLDVPADVMRVALHIVCRNMDAAEHLDLPDYVQSFNARGAHGGVIIRDKRKGYQILHLVEDLGIIGILNVYATRTTHCFIGVLQSELDMFDDKTQSQALEQHETGPTVSRQELN